MISWEVAYKQVVEQVEANGGNGAVRALASPTFPNEPNFVLGQFMARLSDRKNISLLPTLKEEDQEFPGGFRISGEKGGNLRGVKAMVPGLAAALKSLMRGEPGVLIAMDGDGRAHLSGELKRLLEWVAFKVVVASLPSELTAQADIVLPVATPYAREGTITNDKGLVQWLQPALHPVGEVRPDWQVMAELGQLLTGEGHLYTCAGDVTWKINQTTPGYSQITRFRLGRTGQFSGSEAA